MPSAAGFPTAEFPTTSEAVVAASRVDERNECMHCNLTAWGHFAPTGLLQTRLGTLGCCCRKVHRLPRRRHAGLGNGRSCVILADRCARTICPLSSSEQKALIALNSSVCKCDQIRTRQQTRLYMDQTDWDWANVCASLRPACGCWPQPTNRK